MMRTFDGASFKKAIEVSVKWLDVNKQIVNDLNVYPVPDGDTGTNMYLTLAGVHEAIKGVKSSAISDVVEKAAEAALMNARGNSGTALSQFFIGFSDSVKGKRKVTTKELADAFKKGAEQAYFAFAEPVEGTILTVMREAAEAAAKSAALNTSIKKVLEDVIEAAEKALKKTPEMLPVLAEAGVVDAGGKGFVYMLEAWLGRIDRNVKKSKTITLTPKIEYKDLEYRYCTEFIVNSKVDERFKSKLSKFGGSLLVVGSKNMTKVHIHTNDPDKVFAFAKQYGELRNVKVDDMQEQHTNLLFDPFAVIAVVPGKGIAKEFLRLGADIIIYGGQTMNPSVKDIKQAVENCRFNKVVILPNNKNVQTTAELVKSVSKKKVYVLPTKTIPQGLKAILSMDKTKPVEYNMKNINLNVTTIEITYATRTTKSVKKGEIVAIKSGKIVGSGTDPTDLAIELLKGIKGKKIYIFYSKDVKMIDALKLDALLVKTNHVRIRKGYQPHYHYIIAVI
ncbi:hypothetical protein DRN75_00990 [Nanoarchaeota archaeon]|nr:MAG: hypothetical protein DRN75_00990 [Nanoarchaeota archaeon]